MRSTKKSTRSKSARTFNAEIREHRSSEPYPEILREYASTGFRDDPRSEPGLDAKGTANRAGD